jgi:hypothetical protein
MTKRKKKYAVPYGGRPPVQRPRPALGRLSPGQNVDGTYDDAEDRAYGYTFAEWLRAAGRTSSASDYDLRAAWRAGEKPENYKHNPAWSKVFG